MITELIKKAKKIYGQRVTEENKCAFCGKYIGNDYCDCTKSYQINLIAKRINKKAEFDERVKVLEIKYNLAESSNVPMKYASVAVDDYKVRTAPEKLVFEQVKKYKDTLVENWLTGKNLLLIGNFGTAKSFLKSGLCNFCTQEKKLSARYINITSLMDEIKSTFSDGTPKSADDVIKTHVDVDFLFIDDIDKEKPTEFLKNMVYKIVNQRYEQMKPIIASANSDLEQLEKILGEATTSRLVEKSEIVYFNANNDRLKVV